MELCGPVAGGCMHMCMQPWPRSTFMRCALHTRRTLCSRPLLHTSAAQQTWATRMPAPQPPAAPVQAPQPAVQQQTALTVQRRPVPRRQSFSILRSLIMEKQVITRNEGKSLGFVEQLYVLPQQLAVVNINLKNDRLPLTPPTRNIPIAALQQIGDVLLVQDENVTRQPDPYSEHDAIKLVGLEVVTEAGVPLGKVRDFSFNPDTGLLDTIKLDRFGQPLVPASVVSVFSVPVADVTRVSFNRVTVASQHKPVQESHGLLDRATDSLFGMGVDNADDEGSAYALMEWERMHGRQYRQYYGMDKFAEGTAAPQRQLPPPQTQSFQDRLAPQPAAQQLNAQPVRGRQPRMQQQVYAADAAPSRDPRSRRQVAVPTRMPSTQVYQPQDRFMQGQGQRQPAQTFRGRRADDQRQALPSAQRQPAGSDMRARPGNAEARQAIADARRERLLTSDPQQQDVQRQPVPQRQQLAQRPQSSKPQDAGRAWLEYEKSPVGRM